MLNLQPMSEEEFVAYKEWMVEDYASEISNNFRITMDEARTSATKQIDSMLSQGLSTPNHFLYNIILTTSDGDSRLGYLWIIVEIKKKRCFIADIFLHEEFRHQGWGRKILELLETNMKEEGINRISLSVFANNNIAREFYIKMGYEFTDMNMQKWLVD